MRPAVRSDATWAVSNFNRARETSDDSPEEDEACAYIAKHSNISEAPMFEPVPLVVRSDLKAFVIVVSAIATYLFIAII